MNNFSHLLYNYVLKIGISENVATYINMSILLLLLIIVVVIVDYAARKIIRTVSHKISNSSKTKFDDLLISNRVPRNIAHIIPLMIAIGMTPVVFTDFPNTEIIVEKSLKAFGIILTLWIVRSLLNTLKDFFKTLPRLKDKPVDSYIQVFMIFAWIAGFVLVFAIITGTPIWKFFTALGAASAIILLIFKDTIMGFVASIQISINDMVRIGDWITFEKYGADGDVIEINLATVKVQNFDKTITTIPTYSLISESFKNWRGMVNSDGRRIKRSIHIKLNSIHYLNDTQIKELEKIDIIREYLQNRQKKIDKFNNENTIDKSLPINGRNLTNLGVFRKYIETYVANHSGVNQDMMIMARQLAPTTQGIPIEIYAFSSDKRWQNYEYIMADIFDHIIASVSYFDVELFELPSNLYIQK